MERYVLLLGWGAAAGGAEHGAGTEAGIAAGGEAGEGICGHSGIYACG